MEQPGSWHMEKFSYGFTTNLTGWIAKMNMSLFRVFIHLTVNLSIPNCYNFYYKIQMPFVFQKLVWLAHVTKFWRLLLFDAGGNAVWREMWAEAHDKFLTREVLKHDTHLHSVVLTISSMTVKNISHASKILWMKFPIISISFNYWSSSTWNATIKILSIVVWESVKVVK